MSFTAHVRALLREDRPTAEETGTVLAELRGRLKGELRRRGLFLLPPSYLGYAGGSWDEEATFEELLHDAYCNIFLEPLDSLALHLEKLGDVDGMIFNNLRFFFNRLMRVHDPLGSRIYNTLSTTVDRMRTKGEIYVLDGETIDPDGELRSATILTLDPSAAASASTDEDLAAVVDVWVDELMPELVTAMGPGQTKVYEAIRRSILGLAEQGLLRFRFGDLLKPLKQGARSRWRSVGLAEEEDVAFVEGEDRMALLIRQVRPEIEDLARRQAVDVLTRCVTRGIDRIESKEKTRLYLHRLWTYLRDFMHDEREKLPGRLALSKALDIPKGRFADLLEEIQPIFFGCFTSAFGKAVL